MVDHELLHDLAAAQHGLVAYHQLADLGLSAKHRMRLASSIHWERLPGLVLRVAGSADTRLQRLGHAVLAAGPGAAASGETAAAHWGARGVVFEPFQIARVRDHVDRDGGGVRHEPVLLPERHVLVLDGIRVVTPARALFDIAGSELHGADKTWWIDRVERLVHNAVTDRLVSRSSLTAMLGDMAQRGRPGIRIMRGVIERLPANGKAHESGIETRVAQLCRRAGLPPMRMQVDLGDTERWIGRVDFLDGEFPFVLEIQSERFHTSGIDRQLDAGRRVRLEAAGYVVDELTDNDVWYRPDHVIEVIRRGRMRAALLVQTR